MIASVVHNSFEALNVDNLIIEEVATGNKATTSVTQEVKLVLVGDDEKPLEKVDYPGNMGSEESVDSEITIYHPSKPMGVGYDPYSLLEQWRESVVDDDYDAYDDDR
ncbi:hypothetical protein Tco_1498934 [Tanacetum coccineum]